MNIPKLSDLLELTSNNNSADLIINLEIKSTPIEDNLTPPPNVMAKLIIDEVNKTELKDNHPYDYIDEKFELNSICNLFELDNFKEYYSYETFNLFNNW